jgi:hypothetical protein
MERLAHVSRYVNFLNPGRSQRSYHNLTRSLQGVLSLNLPDPTDPMASVFFRYPRQFLGSIYYDRLPCKPFTAYGKIEELPCPDLPTQSPTLPQPSLSHVTNAPIAPVTPVPFVGTRAPQNPTDSPTVSSTLSASPSLAPSTTYPTGSPIVPMRASIAVNLRNVPSHPMSVRCDIVKLISMASPFPHLYSPNYCRSRENDKFIAILTTLLNKHVESQMVR